MRTGIIAGLGATVTARLTQDIVQRALDGGATADHHFPEFLIHSVGIYPGTPEGEFDRDVAFTALAQALDGFESAGCTHAAIACCTLREEFNRVIASRDLEPIDITEPLSAAVNQGRDVMVLCSKMARNGTYRGHKTVAPALQYLVDLAITSSMTQMTPRLPAGFAAVLRGQSTVFLGCTELSAYAEELRSQHPGIEFIDPLETLISRVTQKGRFR